MVLKVDRVRTVAGAVALLAGTMVFSSGLVGAQGDSEQKAAQLTAAVLGDELTDRIHDRVLGMYVDGKTGEYVVVVPDKGDRPRAGDFAEFGLPVRVEERNITPQEIEDIRSRAREAATPSLGSHAFATYFDGKAGVVVIEGTVPKAKFAAILGDFPGKVEFRSVQEGSRLGRQNDGVPHIGGAFITDNSGFCTSGFTVKKTANGNRKMMTAGHCFALGDDIEGGTGLDWGSVSGRASYPAKDLEVIDGTDQTGCIYVGGSTGSAEQVTAAHNPAVGSEYCMSGVSTYEHCGLEVYQLDADFCDDDGCTVSLIRSSGGGSAQGGDSGAPFFQPDGSSDKVRGLVIAHLGASLYSHKWSTIASTFDVDIVTSCSKA